jgi:hypothetical protein
LDLHATVLVDVDLAAGRADHERRLRATDHGARRTQVRAEDGFLRERPEIVLIGRGLVVHRGRAIVAVELGRVTHLHDVETTVEVGAEVLRQRELVSRGEPHARAHTRELVHERFGGVELIARVPVARTRIREAAGIVVNLLGT